MLRTRLYADPSGLFLHDVILESCGKTPNKMALADVTCGRRFSYADYGEAVEAIARGLVQAGLRPGEVVAILLSNSWEFCVTYHAATLALGVPTLLNPSYREREIRYQLENSGAAVLISDAPLIGAINLSGLSSLRKVYTTRQPLPGTEGFASLLHHRGGALPPPSGDAAGTLAALPYSSGTTGLPKGVMLSHTNLVANIYQFIGPDAAPLTADDIILCSLPLYHIFGLTVALSVALTLGATLVIMPRFETAQTMSVMVEEGVTMMPLVPPIMNAFCQAAETGRFPKDHKVRWVKSGAAPLAPELARRFTHLTGIPVNQGYGMTEASPVTHLGYMAPPEMNRPSSIGQPLCQTDCRILGAQENEVGAGESGELVMRGPQFMMGYWKEPDATAAALRDGWYWSGDIVNRDADDFYYVLDRRKEMIKYKGFPVAPAEVEAVLLEHPAVRDCGVIAKPDVAAGEIPCAFVVLRQEVASSKKLDDELRAFVAERLTSYKQPREIRFVDAVPRTPSGKILRRELRNQI
nr:long-chain-fatty-acid--CoA ligase [uncultured bacterium]